MPGDSRDEGSAPPVSNPAPAGKIFVAPAAPLAEIIHDRMSVAMPPFPRAETKRLSGGGSSFRQSSRISFP